MRYFNQKGERVSLDELFDERFGILDGSTILTHEEYLEHKKFSLSSGLFEFQVEKYGWGYEFPPITGWAVDINNCEPGEHEEFIRLWTKIKPLPLFTNPKNKSN